jgi:predicted nucleic acid-binding protein
VRQVVVDASVAVKWVVVEDHSAEAAILLAFTRGRVRLVGQERLETQMQEDAR